MKILNRFFFIPLLLIVFFILFYSVYEEVKNKTIAQFNSEQLVIANAASRGITDYMTDCDSELDFLSGFPGIINLNDQGKVLLENYFDKNSNQIEAITRVDSQGVILATYPENRESIGRDISYQDHVSQIIETRKPIISDVFMAVQGYLAIAIHVPVIKDNKFDGSLAVLIAIDKIGKRYLENIKIGKSGYAILLSENNIEIFSPFHENISKSIKEVSQNDPTVDQLIEEIEKKNFGSLKCILDKSETIDQGEKHVVFKRIPLGNTYWTILISVPLNEVYKTILGFRNKLMLLFSLIFAVMLIYFYSFTKAKNIIKEESKRKIAEKKLTESEAYNRTLFNQSPIGLALTKMDGQLIDINGSFAKIIDRTIDETLTLSYWDITPKKYAEQEQHQLDSLNSTGRYGPYEKEYIHKDGHLVPVRLQGLIIEKEGIPHILSSVEDITESKLAEKNLKESKFFFEQLFVQSSTSTQLLDPDGWCIKINPKLSELFGVMPAHIEGKKYNILKDDEIIRTGVIDHLKRVFEFKETVYWEVNFDIKHASESTGVPVTKTEKRWFQNIAYPILNAEGNLMYVIIQHEDISRRKQSELEIKKLNEELEQKVSERTKDLENKIAEIERMNKLFIDRELRMKELKEKIRELQKKQKNLDK